MLYHSARVSYRNTIFRNRTGHYTACSDDTVPADSDSRQQDGTSANPYTVLYSDGQSVCAAYFFAFRPILHHAFVYFRGMGGCIYLHIGSNQHIAANINAVVVHESTIHVDNHFVAYENMFPVFTMEINIHMHSFSHAPEHLTQQSLLTLRVGVIRSIELCQQPPCAQNHFHYFRVFTSNKRFARQTFLVFRFHFISPFV